MNQKMTLEQAFNNIKGACLEFRGTLRDHEALQMSLHLISEALKPKESNVEAIKKVTEKMVEAQSTNDA